MRDWLYVDDHADALLLIAERGVAGGPTMSAGARNAQTSTICGRSEVLDERLPNAPSRPHESLIKFVADRPGLTFVTLSDARRLSANLAGPATKIEEGLANTVDWYLANDGWIERIRARGFNDARIGLGAKKTAG
ncbi:MAG: hypothetical protein R3C55_08560 [Parvularculaceae bacterium]